jgi:hypothetical protein
MSDPRRLSSSATSKTVRALLQSGRAGAPPGFKDRAFDVAREALATSAVVAGAGAAGKGAVAGAWKGASLTTVHWVGIACVAGVCTAGALVVSRALQQPSVSTRAAERRSPPAPSEIRSGRAGSDWSPVAVDTASLPLVPAASTSSSPIAQGAPGESSARPAPAPEDHLQASGDPLESSGAKLSPELVPLDLARRAIAAGEPRRALSILDDYDARFPGGVLRSEATMLRIELLLATGRRADAVRLAEGLLARDPNGPYAARIRSIVGAANP